jgi:uncharacterized protein (TIGR03437 family)
MKKLTLFAFIYSRLMALPLWFEPNQGQAHPAVQFLAHTPGGYVYFARDKMAIRDIRMDLVGANRLAEAQLEEPLGGVSSYFIGRQENGWHTVIPQYARVRYKNIYVGIDLVYYASGPAIEYDFILKAGADSSQIKLVYNKPVQLGDNGDLLIAGLRQKRPKAFQNGREIACDYLLTRNHQFQLVFAPYDHAQGLTVDPVLEYSTYLGGSVYDSAHSIAVDSAGNAYIVGTTRSPDAPSLNPFQQPSGLSYDVFVIKITSGGNQLVYAAYLGGFGDDEGNAIVVDATGSAYIGGETNSINFPLKNPVQPKFGGGNENGFVARLSPGGDSLIFSTFLGGGYLDGVYGLAIDSSGSTYVTGYAFSSDFPVKNAVQTTNSGGSDAFAAKLSPQGGTLIYSTYLGGSNTDTGHAIAVDAGGNAYVVGATISDDFPVVNPLQRKKLGPALSGAAFVTKISPAGDELVFSTFLGGGGGAALSLAVGTSGNVYVGGGGSSMIFPTTQNAFQSTYGGGEGDAWIAALTSSGNALVYSTYLGGSALDTINQIALDTAENVYAIGATNSPDFPLKNPIQANLLGLRDVFVSELSTSGKVLLFSTLIGGSSNQFGGGIAVGPAGAIYVAGWTSSSDFPTVHALEAHYGGGTEDGFVAKIAPDPMVYLTVVPNTLQFSFVIGQTPPPAQTIAVSSTPSSSPFAATSDSVWLSLSLTATSTPATISVSVDPTNLAPGQYTGMIRLDPQTAVQVNLRILDRPPIVISVSPAVISTASSDTTVTIKGSGFIKGAVIQLVNSSSLLPATLIDSNTLQVTIPAALLASPTTYSLMVLNPQSAPSAPITLVVGMPVPNFTAAGVVNAASFVGGPVAPGEIVTIFGTNLTGNVTFENTPATLVYSSPTQVSVTVPYSIASPTTTLMMGATSAQLQVVTSDPGIFAAVPVHDNLLTLYATGCGPLTTDDLPRCALQVSVTVNGELGTVLYAGIAPGLVQGANQVNIQLPADITSGQLTIVLTAGDSSSTPFRFTLP